MDEKHEIDLLQNENLTVEKKQVGRKSDSGAQSTSDTLPSVNNDDPSDKELNASMNEILSLLSEEVRE